jgi:hypothetical protein
MQVRAHDEIDLVRPRTSGGEPVQIGGIEHVPKRPRGPRFVIAATCVDENLLLADLQKPAMHAELDEAGAGVIVIGRKPMLVLCEDLLVPFRKEITWPIHRQIRLLDPRDRRLAKREPGSRGLCPRGGIALSRAAVILSKPQYL